MDGFRQALESLLNSWSKENGSNTPDWILADYLIECLENWDKHVTKREKWYGRQSQPEDNHPFTVE